MNLEEKLKSVNSENNNIEGNKTTKQINNITYADIVNKK